MSLVACAATAATLPERIDQFKKSFEDSKAIATYDLRVIQTDFPTSLLSPDSLLPQTDKYPLQDMQRLYTLATTCKGKYPLSPTVTEPLVFSRAMCKGTNLPIKWFIRSGLIHPGGGTYAARYAESHPEQYKQLLPFMHIKERPMADPDSLLGRLQVMPYDSIAALISGSETIIAGNEFWLRRGTQYYVFDQKTLDNKLTSVELLATPAAQSEHCYVKSGNVCWDIKNNSDVLFYSILALGIVNVILIFAWGYSRWLNKRKELRSRMLVLQILTHELRTPIASLSLTVEGFRREFEHLPDSVYDEFRRLCEDTRRLRQLAEASKDYLQSDTQTLATEWIPSVDEWLEYRYTQGEFNINIELNQDLAVKVNIYWLGTCVDNLVRNACKYGVDPVKLKATTYSNKLVLEVIDQGQLTKKDWAKLRKPFVSKSGLGLGLTIVESMVARMGGTMSLSGPPTTFKLEIPCETDTATR
ncbi:sensor histidine kinase VxrA [Vibrio gangliei]|uniref:sensor histidine kinase VxrA n=1 Tax=Vibrio gangliei TaxID=2077090 RepID=UPI000D0128E2|nr:sensor histidine kinase VxrA [Vibrio gangliei]